MTVNEIKKTPMPSVLKCFHWLERLGKDSVFVGCNFTVIIHIEYVIYTTKNYIILVYNIIYRIIHKIIYTNTHKKRYTTKHNII